MALHISHLLDANKSNPELKGLNNWPHPQQHTNVSSKIKASKLKIIALELNIL